MKRGARSHLEVPEDVSGKDNERRPWLRSQHFVSKVARHHPPPQYQLTFAQLKLDGAVSSRKSFACLRSGEV